MLRKLTTSSNKWSHVWDMNSRHLDEGAVFSDPSVATSSPNTQVYIGVSIHTLKSSLCVSMSHRGA